MYAVTGKDVFFKLKVIIMKSKCDLITLRFRKYRFKILNYDFFSGVENQFVQIAFKHDCTHLLTFMNEFNVMDA